MTDLTNSRPNWLTWLIKIGILCLSCLLGFGSYFCYDSPAALQTEIKQSMNLTQSEFMSLYAWYSWPNVFLCFVGGYLIDAVLGKRWGGITFASLVLLGQSCLAFGLRRKSLMMMDVGRLVFGLGGETLAVVGNAYSVAWFSAELQTIVRVSLKLFEGTKNLKFLILFVPSFLILFFAL